MRFGSLAYSFVSVVFLFCGFFVFFFKQKTAYEMRISDWSSDVCSSDLAGDPAFVGCDRSQVRAAVRTIAGSEDGRVGGAHEGADLDAPAAVFDTRGVEIEMVDIRHAAGCKIGRAHV